MSITAEEALPSMAQSSNYKQFSRGTRVLTEESGFAGGMVWTGNNIDATHLKAIVNCDYDDTTGYLKTRHPFVTNPDSTNVVDTVLLDHKLIGAYKICPFDKDDNLLDAGILYVLAKTNTVSGVWHTTFNKDNVLCLFQDDKFNICTLDNISDVLLQNINQRSTLLQYDNYLYGIGVCETQPESWINLYYVKRTDSKDDEDNDIYQYHFEQKSYTDINDKINSVKLLEAASSGFNAARGQDIFAYTGEEGDDLHILGAYCVEDSTGVETVVVSPRIGQESVTVRLLTTYHKDKTAYAAMFQLNEEVSTTELDAQWSLVDTVQSSSNGTFNFDFTFGKKNTTLGFVYYGETKPDDKPPVYSDAAVDYLKPYVVVANSPDSNLKAKAYDFTTLDGSCLWKNRMCVWSTRSNNNCLFLSEVDNFFYYPVPSNVAVFDTNVINCIPYKDTLLVFTANKIYRVSENNDGSFSQTVVQNNMPLSREDSAHLTAIKNMVLFKSGNYFYMLVPKSQSLTDELIIAPIYKNIAGFLNTLDKSTQEMLQLMYPEYLFNTCTVTQATSDTYVEQDTVHILYDVHTNVNELTSDNTIQRAQRLFKMFLNYNTNLRSWTVYFEETTTDTLEAAFLDSTNTMTFIRVSNIRVEDIAEDGQLVEKDKSKFKVVSQQSVSQFDENASQFRILLDTGYRTLSSATQKRFREIQLKLYCGSENNTSFGTAFLVDGVWRRNYTRLEEARIYDDTTKKNYVSLMPTLDVNTFITELSMPVDETGNVVKNPGSDSIELSDWSLDFSHFIREAPVTVRIPVSGKGFNPRFILMAPVAFDITINEINWVYRLMNGR